MDIATWHRARLQDFVDEVDGTRSPRVRNACSDSLIDSELEGSSNPNTSSDKSSGLTTWLEMGESSGSAACSSMIFSLRGARYSSSVAGGVTHEVGDRAPCGTRRLLPFHHQDSSQHGGGHNVQQQQGFGGSSPSGISLIRAVPSLESLAFLWARPKHSGRSSPFLTEADSAAYSFWAQSTELWRSANTVIGPCGPGILTAR